jgi:PAS domain S-box-containing protein
MRQWELIGITDAQPVWAPPRKQGGEQEQSRIVELDKVLREVASSSVFFWTTDEGLRLRTVTPAAAEMLGWTSTACEGRDLLEVVGSEGQSLPILEAHVSALRGETTTFTLRGAGRIVKCRVAPMTEGDEIIGTFCLAVTREIIDARWDSEKDSDYPLEVA